MSSPNSWERAAAVSLLDPADSEQLKMVLKVAEGGQVVGRQDCDWFLRQAAADLLAKNVGKGTVAAELTRTASAGRAFPESKVEVFKGRRMPFIEDPTRCFDVVEKFLR